MVRFRLLLGGLMLAQSLAGCEGGHPSGPQIRETAMVHATSSVQPPLPPLFDCDSTPVPVPATVDTRLDGVWEGMLSDCSNETSYHAFAYVTADGQLRIHADLWRNPDAEPGLMRVELETSGASFAGSGRYFHVPYWSATMNVRGQIGAGEPIIVSSDQIVERSRLDGLWSEDSGGYGYFALDAAPGQNLPPVELEQWPVEWDIWRGVNEGGGSWTLQPDGEVTGLDAAGCEYAGRFAAEVPGFFYEITLTVSSCLLEGTYRGVARLTGGPFNDLLFVAMDDGDQRSIVMQLGSR